MRSEKEVFTLFDNIAKTDDRIRVMTLEGSRVNPNVKPDQWQDYDITFLVTDVNSYLDSDEWLSVFGVSSVYAKTGGNGFISRKYANRLVFLPDAVF